MASPTSGAESTPTGDGHRFARRIAVVGAGTMGRRIAVHLAYHGASVAVYDPASEQRLAAASYFEDQRRSDQLGLLAGTLNLRDDLEDALSGAQLVIETVPERLELKRETFARLDQLASPEAVLATNSSSYASRELIELVSRPQRVVNLHFFHARDTPLAPCVEVMSCGKTDPEVMRLIRETMPDFGLETFECRSQSTGFLFNRVWAAIKRESLAAVADGVGTPQELDRIWTILMGTAEGPFRIMDMVGLDVVLEIEEHYASEYPWLPESPRRLLRQYIAEGRLGAKVGAGFYEDYPADGGSRSLDSRASS